MRGQCERSGVAVDHGGAQLSVRVHLAIDAITNPKVAASAAQGDIFALVNSDHPADCGHEYGTIGAFMDLKAVHTGAYVEI